MKLFIFLFVSFFSYKLVIAQNVKGFYSASNSKAYVNVTDSIVEFRVWYGCCLLTEMYGIGSFIVQDSLLKIKCFVPSKDSASSYQIIQNLKDKNRLEIQVVSEIDFGKYYSVQLIDESTGDVLISKHTNENDSIFFDGLEKFAVDNLVVKIMHLGYHSYQIPLSDISGKSIQVHLKHYEILKDEEVYFKIKTENGEIQLVGLFFPNDLETDKLKFSDIGFFISHFPWKWKYRNHHKASPSVFIKQK